MVLSLGLCVFFFCPAAAPDMPVITAEAGQLDPYQTRSELLMDATAFTGVPSPEQAAAVWATGLKIRSAALQYTVMSGDLQREYARQLDELRSNWVTGMSSPWVDSFSITELWMNNGTHAQARLRFTLATSAGPAGVYYAWLWLVKEENFWRIWRIRTDDELYWYTLYKP